MSMLSTIPLRKPLLLTFGLSTKPLPAPPPVFEQNKNKTSPKRFFVSSTQSNANLTCPFSSPRGEKPLHSPQAIRIPNPAHHALPNPTGQLPADALAPIAPVEQEDGREVALVPDRAADALIHGAHARVFEVFARGCFAVSGGFLAVTAFAVVIGIVVAALLNVF